MTAPALRESISTSAGDDRPAEVADHAAPLIAMPLDEPAALASVAQSEPSPAVEPKPVRRRTPRARVTPPEAARDAVAPPEIHETQPSGAEPREPLIVASSATDELPAPPVRRRATRAKPASAAIIEDGAAVVVVTAESAAAPTPEPAAEPAAPVRAVRRTRAKAPAAGADAVAAAARATTPDTEPVPAATPPRRRVTRKPASDV